MFLLNHHQELRDLTKLDGVACVVRNEELKRGRTPASLEEIKAQRPKARIDTLLTKVQYLKGELMYYSLQIVGKRR